MLGMLACFGANVRAAQDPIGEVVVTAARIAMPRGEFSGSLTRIGRDALALTGATHHAESFNRIPGVYVQRNSGQESLTAIRSPVLTGPGSCGAFLVLEDGLPLRPTGFCNVNELFEINTEQAGAIEIVRGPGPAVYGANAVHGIVNVTTPAAGDLPVLALALEGGSEDYRRARLESATAAGGNRLGLYGHATRDAGFRDASGFDEAKLNLLLDRPLREGELRVRLASTVLNQETAGFIRGFDSYRSEAASEANPNPEAFRDAWSARASAHWSRISCEGCNDDLRFVLRRSQMRFLQHFLLGKPLEENAQTSAMLSASIGRPWGPALTARAGVDVEWADSNLLEIQDRPTDEGTAVARAIRPVGRHYDYTVDSRNAGGYVALEWRPSPRLTVGAALRGDRTEYDYDNRMLAGNTAESGAPCPFGGCLFSRPADREDSFTNFAPKLDARLRIGSAQRLYFAAARGFRPPELTELYRLQRQQQVADLDSERLDSLEWGWLLELERVQAALAVFALDKRNVILRDANAFNVSDGRTMHRGVEYELRWRLGPAWRVEASGTFARHRYDFTRAIEGGESIVAGNDVDTAPREVHGLRVGYRNPRLDAELELAHVGEYFLDASNTARYPGHALANVRLAWTIAPSWRATLRVINLADRRYADRADFAFGDYRYFPGRGRSGFLEIACTARDR
jgi:outer membrane receptor protein involved in Fe transport